MREIATAVAVHVIARGCRVAQACSPRRRGAAIVALALILGPLAACGTRPALKPNPQPKTSYQMLVPKGVLRYTLEPGETAVQPMPDKRVPPVYPPTLVHPDAAPVTLVAQLVMDKDGHVQGVYPVSDTASAATQALFEAAVEHAARQWTFTPLWVQHPNGDGTYRLASKPFSLWYVFHFTVVDGKPIVETVKR